MFPTCFPYSPTRSPTKSGAVTRIGSRRVTRRPGDSVKELSGAEGTEAVRGDLTTKLRLHCFLVGAIKTAHKITVIKQRRKKKKKEEEKNNNYKGVE